MTIKEQAVSDAMIEKVWADFVNCQDDRYFGNKTKRGHQLIVLRRFADSILASHPLEQQQADDKNTAIRLAMQALSAFGDTEEGVTTAYNILKDAVR